MIIVPCSTPVNILPVLLTDIAGGMINLRVGAVGFAYSLLRVRPCACVVRSFQIIWCVRVRTINANIYMIADL